MSKLAYEKIWLTPDQKPKHYETAIIFDWDNTLVNTWPIIHTALNATLRAKDLPEWTFDMTRRRVKKSMRDSFPEVFGENWQDAGEIYQAEYRKHHLSKLEALEGAEDLLKAIKKRGIFCVVVSNKKGDNLRLEIENIAWGHYFHAVVGAQDAAYDKPYTAPVALAFKDSTVLLDKSVWFIGDSEIDIECAENCGVSAILYGEFAREQENFSDTSFAGFTYDVYVQNHEEMLALFERFSQ
jgi:phosphoglycolate phosphatase